MICLAGIAAQAAQTHSGGKIQTLALVDETVIQQTFETFVVITKPGETPGVDERVNWVMVRSDGTGGALFFLGGGGSPAVFIYNKGEITFSPECLDIEALREAGFEFGYVGGSYTAKPEGYNVI